MARWTRMGLLGVGIVALAVQVVPVDRSNPPVETSMTAPPEAAEILHRACYDCHSNETAWPAYSRVAPVSWLVASHVREARGAINFSTWNRYDAGQRAHNLEEIVEVLEEGAMPLWSYTLLHRGARLSETERATLLRWARGTGEARDGGPGQH